MADFNFTVDTGPMAERIRSVNHSVEAVGGAVTAMQVAVVASERMATDKICQSIDGGFYMLLRSKLSQRIAEFTSTMSSRTIRQDIRRAQPQSGEANPRTGPRSHEFGPRAG